MKKIIFLIIFILFLFNPKIILAGGCPSMSEPVGTCTYGSSYAIKPLGTCGGPSSRNCSDNGNGTASAVYDTYINGNCALKYGTWYMSSCCIVSSCSGSGGGGGSGGCPVGQHKEVQIECRKVDDMGGWGEYGNTDPCGGCGKDMYRRQKICAHREICVADPVACSGMTAPTAGTVITTPTTAVLNWTNGTGGTFRMLVTDTETIVLNPTTTNNYTLTNLTPNTTYHWNIVEYKSDTEWLDFGGSCVNTNTAAFTTNQILNGPWWQVKDGDVTTNGSIYSDVNASSFFNTNGAGGFPGVPVYGGSLTLGMGGLSSTLWNANTTTTEGRIFDYSYFENLIPSDFVSPTTYDNYIWTKINSTYTLPATNFGSTKNILFVNGDLTISGNVSLDDNSGFFAVFVSGNITIDPSVTSIEGVYVTNGVFSTGVGTSQLKIRGSVASYGTNGINLQRNLVNDTLPAEIFEYAPDQIALFPEKLGYRRTRWAEIAP